MSAHETVHWHGLQLAEAVRLLDTNLPNGLAEEEAKNRLAKYGPKQLARRIGKPAWMRLRASVETDRAAAAPWQPLADRS